MTYEEIVGKVKKHFQAYKPAGAEDRVAIQVDITGEGEGAFYIEVADGKIAVEPYEYYEHDIKVVASADALMEIVDGKSDLVNANLTGKLYAEGDLQKAEVLQNVVKKAAKKAEPAAKKPAAKKAAAKKPAAKKTAAKKPAAKKPAAKKAAPKKAEEKKPEVKKPAAKKAAVKKAAPKKAAPVKAEPVKAEPVKAEPVKEEVKKAVARKRPVAAPKKTTK